MNDEDQARFFLQFNRGEGDIRCCAHIYNLGVIEGWYPNTLTHLSYS
jgi:hypothetical protein